MKLFKRLMISPLAGNFFNPITVPVGRPNAVAIIKAAPDTLRDRKMIFRSSASRCTIRRTALLNPSMMESIVLFYMKRGSK